MANEQNEAVKKQLEADRAVVEESNRQYAERTRGKPTPTQEENDRAKLGEHILEHEDDGGGPDIYAEQNERARGVAGGERRHMEPASQQHRGYQTRAAHPTAAQPGTVRPKE